MLNPDQQKLVRQLVSEKVHNLEHLIRHENAKSLKDQNLDQIVQLEVQHTEYKKIHDEMQRVGC